MRDISASDMSALCPAAPSALPVALLDPHTSPIEACGQLTLLCRAGTQGLRPHMAHSDHTWPTEGPWLAYGHRAEAWPSRVRTRSVTVESPGCLAVHPDDKWGCDDGLWPRNHLETSARTSKLCPPSNCRINV